MLIISLLIILLGITIYQIIKRIKAQRRKERITTLTTEAKELTLQEFFMFKKSNDDFAGVYILFNINKNIYYVGQAKQTFQRVSAHFLGRGNGDLYSDYKYGDDFTIKLIRLSTSGYDSLNELEKDAILTFDSFNSGYNKTRGNSDNGSGSGFFHPYNNSKSEAKYSKKQMLSLIKKCAQGKLDAPFDKYREIRKGLFGTNIEFPGIYIIYNKSKNLYYIAKTKSIFEAINRHFTGNGNNDIYADYQHGDEITIKTMSLAHSKYSTLDELLKETKKEYSNFASNYTKTK